MSNKAYGWTMATLLASLALLVMLIQHAKDINDALSYIRYFGLALLLCAALYALYRFWHHAAMHTHDRTYRKNEAQALTMPLQIEQAKLEIEKMKIQYEHDRLMIEARRVLVPEGHTVVFPENEYKSIQSTRLFGPAKVQMIEGPAIESGLVIPQPFDLLDVLKRDEISPERIFLARGTEGDNLFVNGNEQLCHGVFNACTGRGKTVIERGVEAQLLAVGHQVIHADIKFSLIDDSGLDFRPIAKRLLDQGPIDTGGGRMIDRLLLQPEPIVAMLQWLALTEIPRRLELFHAGNHNYAILYVFLEEYLYLARTCPEIAELVETIITLGRALKIKLFTVVQNFSAKDTKLSGAMKENFETAWYLGGDDRSGAAILDWTQKRLTDFLRDNAITLGRGLTMLRNNTVAPEAALVRTGMASNDAIYYLLGHADTFTLPGKEHIAPTVSARGTGYQGKGTRVTSAYTPCVVESQRPTRVLEMMPEIDISTHTSPTTGPIVRPPETPVNEEEKPVPSVEESGPLQGFSAGPDDKMFTPLQQNEFIRRYMKNPQPIKEILKQMNAGEGLSHRYAKYASWLLAQKETIEK